MKDSRKHSFAVFLVDDHPLVRQGLALVLEQGGFTIAGEAESAEATLAHPGLGSAHIAVVDLSLDHSSGMDLVPSLCRRGIRVVVYSMHEEATVVRRALAAGAKGYVTKREAAQSLVEAIRTVLNGEDYVSPRAGAGLARCAGEPELSLQQQHLYEMLGQGCDVNEIAARLNVSPRTVETYCTRLLDKLGIAGMKDLRRHAIASLRQQSL